MVERKCVIKGISLVLSIFAVINFMACKTKDKENILLKDVKEQAKVEEQEIRTAIDNGNKYLEEEDYEKAKKWYDKAISISKNSIDTYIKIKDKYLEKGRKDDAYRIVRLAIDNNVDVENMKKELKKIEDTFDTIVINKSIYVGENYQLPSETILNIDGSDVNGKITWDNNKVRTNKSGTFRYTGNIPQYGRSVQLVLSIKESSKKIDTEENKNDINSKSDSDVEEKKTMITVEEAEALVRNEFEEGKYSCGNTGEIFSDEKGKYYLFQVIDIELRCQGYTGTNWVKVYEDGTVVSG
ncbi:Hypothetical protein CM240_2350 [Clostridium bornimense]|uniref:Bacterial Ig-like domain-containing protein n=1 Tax=Clostridium bornimense TaxID=1216932 RepID=W6S575_9CLOT|nr:Ig-like domain-containing protein [Clostridium bornimense]CDM69487.1 Hypothetical protein CM240_2350 [Clostridium bornimense]